MAYVTFGGTSLAPAAVRRCFSWVRSQVGERSITYPAGTLEGVMKTGFSSVLHQGVKHFHKQALWSGRSSRSHMKPRTRSGFRHVSQSSHSACR